METVFEVQKLCKSYGKQQALSNLTMKIPKGAIYGFVGKNGAGKTTLMKILCGLQSHTSGKLSLFGAWSESHEANDSSSQVDGTSNKDAIVSARKRIGAIVENPAIYSDMTAMENMRQQYRILGKSSFDGIAELLHMVGLEDTGRKKVRNFSMGMKQKLGIAIALSANPEFLVLDEPLNGLDPQGILDLRELLRNLNQEKGVTILISSHILGELSKLATHYGFLDHGKMLAEMTAEELNNLCKKATGMEVSDTMAFEAVMKEQNIPYEMVKENQVQVDTDITITKLATLLLEKNCEIISCWKMEENLEEFFLKAVEDPTLFQIKEKSIPRKDSSIVGERGGQDA